MISVVADVHVHNFPKFGGPLTSGVNRRGWYTIKALRRAVQIVGEATETNADRGADTGLMRLLRRFAIPDEAECGVWLVRRQQRSQ